MLNALLKTFNHRRKAGYFQQPLFQTKKEYAFVGVGVHSITSLYPILRHFNIRLRYICTKNADWQQQLSPLFPNCRFTHDLTDILNDNSVAGVFVCTDPDAHFDILSRLLRAGKPVFIEKPPCRTLAQLRELQQISPSGICKIGLQRRYWPGNKYLIKKCPQAVSYIYQFQTGPLSQGDPFTELFIHPLDYAGFLFGQPTIRSFSKHKDAKGITLQLHLSHPNGCSGLIHLSTHYSWNPPLESLTLNIPGETLTLQYPTSVSGTKMPLRPMNVPTERLLNNHLQTKQYYSGTPTLTPAWETNSLLVQGFLGEIETFVSLVEDPQRTGKENANDLASLTAIYELLHALE